MELTIFTKASEFIRPRLIGTFLAIVVYCVPIYVLTWYFRVFDDLFISIFMSLLVLVMPVAEFFSSPRPWKSRTELLGFALFFALVLLLLAGDKFSWGSLRANTAIALALLPWCWLVWQLIGRNWLLLTGLMLALVVLMIYWIAALKQTDDSLELLLLPLPVVILGGLFWAPLARWIWEIAKRRKGCRIGGPGMQVLAMSILFFPTTLFAVVVPGMLGLSQIWSAVSLTIVGVLLSAVVSEPLRRFLLEWGKLSPNLNECPEQRQNTPEREE